MQPASAPFPVVALGQEVGEKCAVEHESVVRKIRWGWSPFVYHRPLSSYFQFRCGNWCNQIQIQIKYVISTPYISFARKRHNLSCMCISKYLHSDKIHFQPLLYFAHDKVSVEKPGVCTAYQEKITTLQVESGHLVNEFLVNNNCYIQITIDNA